MLLILCLVVRYWNLLRLPSNFIPFCITYPAPIKHSHIWLWVTVAHPLSSWWCSLHRKWTDWSRAKRHQCSCLCLLERAKDLEVPVDFLKNANLREPELSVKELVGVKLPPVLSGIISNKAARWFSKDPPSTSDMQILQRSILPPAFITQLEEAIGHGKHGWNFYGGQLPNRWGCYWIPNSLKLIIYCKYCFQLYFNV